MHADAEPPAKPLTVLLPAFDEYLLGHKDRSAVLPAARAGEVVPGGNGVFLGSLLVDGEVRGTWRRQERKDRVEVTLTPFDPLPARTMRSVEAAVASYGEFLGVPATLA